MPYGLVVIMVWVSCWGWQCASLPHFQRQTDAQQLAGTTVRADYPTYGRYFGFLPPGLEPDGMRDQRKVFMIYLWLQQPVEEIGVRILSPVLQWMGPLPDEGAGSEPGAGSHDPKVVQDPYFSINRETPFFFSPLFWLERCVGLMTSIDGAAPSCTHWQALAESQTDPLLPPTRRSQKGNGQIRLMAKSEEILSQLPAGLYRLQLTHGGLGDAQGSFLLEWGLYPASEHLAIGRSVTELWHRKQQPGDPLLPESP